MDLGSVAQVLECRQLVILLLCVAPQGAKLQAASSKLQAVDMKEIIGYKILNKGEINI
jgi:hypothetical protein|tara:strand:- start:109 stop:282 length:174 start_codon:yes stop_codon:yes gene_type:complete